MLHPEAEIEVLRSGLMSTGFYESVNTVEELYPHAKAGNVLPKIIPQRKTGVLVSCNMYPGVPVTGWTDHKEVMNLRDGDHWPEGYVGCTTDTHVRPDTVPEDLYWLIDEFCGGGTVPGQKQDMRPSDASDIETRLKQLGYG